MTAMFEAAELGQRVAKPEYEREVEGLRQRLLAAQQRLRHAGFPVVLVVGGVDGAGKGETVNTLLEWMDPRYIDTFALSASSDEERERPPMWRFWRALPPAGRIGIFFGGWHSAPIVDRVYGTIKKVEMERRLARVNGFERLLVDDGTLLVKYWMHLSKDRQKKRLRSLQADPATRWRVTPLDWKHFALYDRFRKVSSQALRVTSTADAPWTIVEASDRRFQLLTVGRTLADRLEAQLERVDGANSSRSVAVSAPLAGPGARTILSTVDLTRRLDPDDYDRKLEKERGRLNTVARRAAAKGVSTIVVMEGVDAAGKGGAIRRVASALDARMFSVIPIAAPTEEERRHPYLWRFWCHLPRAGRMTIFDRSWYGRVLVERVEGFCSDPEWQRAYSEIDDFEQQLVAHGTVIVKLWLQISQDEQLRRFRERETIAWKQFKITDEDWRNRERWPLYEQAVNDMIERTSTEVAPWTIVESEDKRYARIKTLETIRRAIDHAL